MEPVQLECGDARVWAATQAPNSIDTFITDAPYGLSFMGATWDRAVPGPEYWAAFWRMAKPGAFLLAFGGTRTWHRLACAIEDAGWEIRDTVMWVYGSGFPKSHDISKALDKAAGAARENKFVNCFQRRAGPTGNKRCPKCGKWLVSGTPCQCPRPQDVALTPHGATWEGWGTALKPAWEPVIVAMKPLDGTFAENALRWGVAGLAIDKGRVGTSKPPRRNTPFEAWSNLEGRTDRQEPEQTYDPQTGRWPANLIHDGSAEVVALFPSQSSPATHQRSAAAHGQIDWNPKAAGTTQPGYGDTGSAARFFYCAKASRREREAGTGAGGNPHPTVKPVALLRYLLRLTSTPTGGVVCDPFMGSGTTGVAAQFEGRAFVGCDSDPAYVVIARQRISWASREVAAGREPKFAQVRASGD